MRRKHERTSAELLELLELACGLEAATYQLIAARADLKLTRKLSPDEIQAIAEACELLCLEAHALARGAPTRQKHDRYRRRGDAYAALQRLFGRARVVRVSVYPEDDASSSGESPGPAVS